MDSLRRRADARNASFQVSLRWPIHIINSLDKIKLSCNTPHQRSTTVSLETYPLKAKIKVFFYRSYCCYGNLLYHEGYRNLFNNDWAFM